MKKSIMEEILRLSGISEQKDGGGTEGVIKALRDTDYRDKDAFFKLSQLLKGLASVADKDELAKKYLSAVSDALTEVGKKFTDLAGKSEIAAWEKRADRLADKVLGHIESMLEDDFGKVAIKSIKIEKVFDKKESDALSGSAMYSIKINSKPIGWVQVSFPDAGPNDWVFHPKTGGGFFDQFSHRFEEIAKEVENIF